MNLIKMTNFVTPKLLHLEKQTIGLLFKNDRICKHVTNFERFLNIGITFAILKPAGDLIAY